MFQLCRDGSSWVEPVRINVSCSKIQRSDARQPLGLESITLPLSHCAPKNQVMKLPSCREQKLIRLSGLLGLSVLLGAQYFVGIKARTFY